ncbi:BamA/OMP85 family outer membrane protein [Rubrivirga sp.]|uniref:BamA/OMP85 family outer membrane protein n=1 Tax=Rubrivirga sp. TaxID=1885344 RepID=UPI003B522AFF
MTPVRPAPSPRPRWWRAAAVALVLAAGAQAQAPLTLVNDSTAVSSVAFDVSDGQTLLTANLELQIATTAPPPSFLFGLIGGDDGGAYPLVPVELAKDAVRLQRYYVESGFPLATVDYAVELDTTDNTGAVTFEITEGPPLLIERVTFAGPGQSDVAAALAPEIRDDWARFTRRTDVRPGDRLDAFALVRLQSQTIGWLRNRGYAWADAGAEQFPDSTGLRAGVRVKVNVGTRARIGRVVVEGDTSLSSTVIAREIPVQSGDLFNASALVDGQQEVFGLGLFSLALVNQDPAAVRGDSVVNVVARVRRGPSRVLNAFGGYFSDGGVTVRGSATHRNAFEGARQLSLNLEARTGIGGISGRSVSGGPITDYRASVSFRQPYVFDRRLSFTVQPSYRIRDDEIESSTQVELANTLLFTRAPLQTAALSLTGRMRDLSRGLGLRLLDAGQFALPPGPFLPDTLEATTGGLGLDVVYGQLDDPLQPTRGFVLRPSLALAAGDVNFGRGRFAATVTVPFRRRVGVVGRATVGGLVPFRGTTPDAVADYVLFRDQLFYAGGTSDVRGWATTLLGPKTFSVTPPVETPGVLPDPSKITSPADVGYIGVGGRYKASASAQVNLPLALGPQWGVNLFVDAGRVAAPSTAPTQALLRAGGAAADSTLADLLDREGGLRVGAGAGLQYLTPVGFVSIALGVKVNPSYLDRRAAAQVYCGSSIDDGVCFSGGTPSGGLPLDDNGRPADGVDIPGYIDARLSGTDFDPDLIPTGSLVGRLFRRTQFHIAIGQTF